MTSKKIVVLMICSILFLLSCTKKFENPLDPGVTTPPSLWCQFEQKIDDEFEVIPNKEAMLFKPNANELKLRFGLNDRRDSDVSIKVDIAVVKHNQDTLRYSVFNMIYRHNDSDSINRQIFEPAGVEIIIPNGLADSLQVGGFLTLNNIIEMVDILSINFNLYAYDLYKNDITLEHTLSQAILPDVPLLLSPPNNAESISINPTLLWYLPDSSEDAEFYNLDIATDEDFSTLSFNIIGITEAEFPVPEETPLSYSTRYYWRVNATSSDSLTTEWSSIWSFITIDEPIPPPSVPQLVYPPNEATGINITPEFTWLDFPEATGYRIQLSLDERFTNIVDSTDVVEASYSISDELKYNTYYYWRVKAVISDTTVTEWSDEWKFRTIPLPPAAPVLISPNNNATNVDINPIFVWLPSESANTYSLQIAWHSSFDSVYVVTKITDIRETNYRLNQDIFNYNTEYYWRVNASNEGGDGAWSNVFRFTTEEGVLPPEKPTLFLPGNLAFNVPIEPKFEWLESEGATNYRLQISSHNSFGENDIVINRSDITEHDYQVAEPDSLEYNTTYFWRVKAFNDEKESDWSVIWRFTTENETEPPLKPVLVSPENGSTDISITPQFQWLEFSDTSTYRIQVAQDNHFGNDDIIINVSDIDELQYTVSELEPLNYDQNYFWRVKAITEENESEWSDIWQFITIIEDL